LKINNALVYIFSLHFYKKINLFFEGHQKGRSIFSSPFPQQDHGEYGKFYIQLVLNTFRLLGKIQPNLRTMLAIEKGITRLYCLGLKGMQHAQRGCNAGSIICLHLVSPNVCEAEAATFSTLHMVQIHYR